MHDDQLGSGNHWFSTPNPLAQPIPYYSTIDQLAADLAFNPMQQIDVTALTLTQIDELLMGEKTPLEPTTQMIRTALTWHSMLHAGLRRRNPLLPRARQLHWEAVLHDPNKKTHPFMAPTRGISVQVVKGVTGTGKSVTMGRFCNLFPQVIRHGENIAAGWKAMTQIVYFEVSISHDGSRGGFLISILMQIDILLGTSFSIDLPRKYKTVDKLAVATVCRLVAYYTGIIFLEEAQLRNLVQGGQADAMQTFLLMLMNSGIPIVFLGNERAFDWVKYSQDISRLYTTPDEHYMPTGAIAMDANSREEADMDWDAIARGVMSYYCLCRPIIAPDTCKQLLRRCSGGIPRLALILWCTAQRNALFFGHDSVGPEDISTAYESSHFREHRNLADGFAFRKSDLLRYEDVDVSLYEDHWQPVRTQSTGAQPEFMAVAVKVEDTASDDIALKRAKTTKSEQAKFRSEQTKKKNQALKRHELSQTLSEKDIRNAGLIGLHLKGLQDTLADTSSSTT